MGDTGGKPWWQSKTIWSAVGILIVTILGAFGVEASEADAAEIGAGLGSIVTGVLALVAIYGRIVARDRIGPPGGQ